MSHPTPDVTSTPSSNASETLADLRTRLSSEAEKKQLQIIQTLEKFGDEGLGVLVDFLKERLDQPTDPVSVVDGKIYQILLQSKTHSVREFLMTHCPHGVVPLRSERDIDYSLLQEALANQDFQAADRLTLQKLCALAGETAVQRKWLYFTEVDSFPVADLQTVNTLWLVYSEGKFGFSVQRDLWLSMGKDWDQLWTKINWKSGNNWTRYPNEFIWDISAPRGHLPLSNQLRGVRVIASLLSHPAWG
ncbi:MAG TPA: GUN4 N-terminal ARM-like repeat domain-containing protein [Elainellaceae cyanobacterium]